MKEFKIPAERLIYCLFKFLWIIVLLPKEGQFVVFAAVIIWWSITNRQFIRTNRVTIWFLAYASFHLISIIIAVITRDYELSRIAAALNTCGIWVIAIWIAGIVSQADNIDIDRIGKYCVINIGIMFVLMMATWQYQNFGINLFLESRTAWTSDFLQSGATMRFCGLLEYSALVGIFILLQFPWAFRYLRYIKYKWSCFVFIPVAFTPVVISHSRVGILLIAIMIFVALNYYFLSNGMKIKTLVIIYVSIALVIILMALIQWNKIVELAGAIVNIRPGSNADRMHIYTDTVNRINETSWIIGAGIKEMHLSLDLSREYPLGSHSTYLGIVFKAGILGGICAVIGLAIAIISIIRRSFASKSWFALLFVTMTALLIPLFAIEDIDGADWLIVFVFATISLFMHLPMNSEDAFCMGEDNDGKI